MGLSDITRGLGSAVFAFGDSFREEQKRTLAKLEEEAKASREDAERKSRELEDLRRSYLIEDRNQAPGLAAKIGQVHETARENDFDRETRILNQQGNIAKDLFGTANEGRIDYVNADYKAQGGLDTTQSRNRIAEGNARTANLSSLLGQFGGQDQRNRTDFIGSVPLAEQYFAHNTNQQKYYGDLLLELDRRNRPQGIGKLVGQLAPVVGMGATLLALRG